MSSQFRQNHPIFEGPRQWGTSILNCFKNQSQTGVEALLATVQAQLGGKSLSCDDGQLLIVAGLVSVSGLQVSEGYSDWILDVRRSLETSDKCQSFVDSLLEKAPASRKKRREQVTKEERKLSPTNGQQQIGKRISTHSDRSRSRPKNTCWLPK